MRGIQKRFGATVALDGVELEIAPGEVHALIGENGAGKSTLMKVLSGAVAADAGEMRLDGAPYTPDGPLAARRAGVAMIYQELTLAPHLSVAENIFLGIEEQRRGWLRRRAMRGRVEEVLAILDHAEISPDAPVRRLGISARQLVEVGRALVANARLIIFDEPTSSLTRGDTERLFAVIGRLRARGVSVIYISHFLEEAREVSDRFTVLRDGRTAGGGVFAATSLDRVIEMMVGRPVESMFPRVPHSAGEPILDLDGLAGRRLPKRAGLTLRRGEILGIAGLVGAGRTELLRAIFGLDSVRRGTVKLAALGDVTGWRPARKARAGLGFLSEDRKQEGLLLNLSIADNVALGDYRQLSRWGWISGTRQRRAVDGRIRELSIKARGASQAALGLSGGNQQKVALARLLHQDADILLLDEPTRGIDVGSKVQVYELMGRLAAAGKAILFVSSYLPELLGVADRIAVMTRGVLSEARPAAEFDEETLLRLATLGEAEPAGGRHRDGGSAADAS
jgi:ribose transport system ATP-binding protein